MVLLGLFVFAWIPQDSSSTFNLEMAVQRVMQDIHYAHELAAITNENCGVQFTANSTYTIYRNATPSNAAKDPLTQQPSVVNINQRFKPVQVLTTVRFEFDPMGRPTIGGGQTVQIGSGNNTATLLVTANTGVVQRQ